MIAVVSQPGILSLAGGLPAPELFPTADYAQALQRVLASDPKALQYGTPFKPLKGCIRELMHRRGVDCEEDEIFVTSGAQQGIDILSRVLLDPGRQVAIEELAFTGIHQAVAPMRPEVLRIPADLDAGLDVDELERRLDGGARPAFLYVIPDAHNPLGVSLAPERRQRLVELSRCYEMPIVEDDPYALLSFDGDFSPPLKALERHWVFYAGSFSKILAPGLRLGWLLLPPELATRISVAKEASDLETSSLTQRAVAAYFESCDFDHHLRRLRESYRERRDAMLDALESHFPEYARWTRPRGGMFVWVELPSTFDCVELLKLAIERERVAFIPGHAFGAPQSSARGETALGRNCMRLSFSTSAPEEIKEGVRRLGALLEEAEENRS